MKKFLIIIILLISATTINTTVKYGKLHVIVTDLRNTNGWVVCHLFNNKEGFPIKSKKAMKYINDFNLKKGRAEFIFDSLPYGVYAFTIHHDENGNKKMDKNIVGLPKEGWACSNNVKGTLSLGLPSFNSAKFNINSEYTKQVIRINY